MKTLSCLALTSLLAAVPAAAQVASLVRDFTPQNPGAENRSANPGAMASAGSRLVFGAGDDVHGYELWASDGTPGGTEILEDSCPGDCGSSWTPLAATKNLTFWAAGFTTSGLWRSDGTRAGTFPLVDGEPAAWALRGNVLFFARCESSAVCALWRSDGTVAGTREILDREVHEVALAGDRVLAATADELWRIDPGSETPVRVQSLGEADFLATVGGRLLMIVNDGNGQDLWSTDGTAVGTRALTQFPNGEPFGNRPNVVATGKRLYFVADDITHGYELWASDGTPQGTKRISNFDYYFAFHTLLSETLREVGPRVVFAASDGLPEDALKLWSTDGRPESTTFLLEPCPRECVDADGPQPPYRTAQAGNAVLFPAVDPQRGVELWATDGTPAGTRLFKEFCPGSCDSTLAFIPSDAAPGGAYLSAQGHIWWSDGTAAGTRRLTRRPLPWSDLLTPRIRTVGGQTFVGLGSEYGGRLALLRDGEIFDLTFKSVQGAGSQFDSFAAYGDRLRFVPYGGGLWETRGTDETTRVVSQEIGSVDRPVTAGGFVYFFQGDGLWRFTDDGALRLATVSDDNSFYGFGVAAAFGSQLYFSSYHDGGAEIWRTDGTVAGTSRFLRLPPGKSVGLLETSGGRLYFNQYEVDDVGEQLFASDGTAAGTRELLTVHNNGSTRSRIVHAGAYDYFVTQSVSDYYQLWRTDGTAAGSRRIMPGADDEPVRFPSGLVEHQGSLYLIGEELDYPFDRAVLWRIDGDIPVRLRTFRTNPSQIYDLASTDGAVVFTADDGEHGLELWATDGTPDGTRLLRDIARGPFWSNAGLFTTAAGRVFFIARDDAHGVELWQSDGTAAGTRLVHDIAPGPDSSVPQQLTVAGDRLYFMADDGLTGRELWALPLSGPAVCQPSGRVLCLQGNRFRVEAAWRDFQLNSGAGTAVPITGGTGDTTGTFWFFSPSNVEVILKVLDGRTLNDHFWVFYGALSNVEYTLTVTDTQTGLTLRYLNPMGQLASVGDTTGFGPQGAFSTAERIKTAPPSPPALIRRSKAPVSAVCEPGPQRLCLGGGRFAVEANWKDFAGKTGTGKAVALSGDTGYFWFFDAANAEVVLKVLDGTPINGKHWVFYGALSNVEYTLTVTDTQTGEIRVYENPKGRFASVADTGAF